MSKNSRHYDLAIAAAQQDVIVADKLQKVSRNMCGANLRAAEKRLAAIKREHQVWLNVPPNCGGCTVNKTENCHPQTKIGSLTCLKNREKYGSY
jgi:hypothetical protein